MKRKEFSQEAVKKFWNGGKINMSMDKMQVYALAEHMHNVYEEQAKKAGWNTQKSCKGAFVDLPDANQKVMLNVALEVLIWLQDRIKDKKIKLV